VEGIVRVRRAKKSDRKQYGNQADVIVTNELTPTHSTVWALPESQARELLGKLAGILRPENTGRSILEILTEEMDAIMDRLMAEGDPPMPVTPSVEVLADWQAWGEERGRAQGVAYALAVLTNPYAPSVPAQRSAAAARWRERQEVRPSGL
jgi:hypothetical protein